MTDSLQHISLLYELSVTTLKHLDPAKTAENFVKKFLSRKNLNYGAIWMIDKLADENIHFSRLYSMPETDDYYRTSLHSYTELFGENLFAETKESIFDDQVLSGNFLYFKLGDIAILELFSKNNPDKVSLQAIYPFKDVFNQLAISIESGFSYQHLQKEIEQRKIAEKSLTHNEEKYRRIVDNIKLGLLEVDTNDIVQYANNSFCELVGYELGEILHKKAAEMFLFEEDRNIFLKENEKRKQGQSSVYELPIKTKTGDKKWGIISGAPNFDSEGNQIGSIGIHLDITEQKQLIHDNAFQESKLKNLFEVSLDALISIDSKGNIIEWNPQAEKIFGYSKQEVQGIKLTDTIIPETYRSAHEEGMDNFHKTKKGPVLNQRIEISAIRKSGEEFPIELTIFPIKHENEHFFTAFVRDITEIKDSREAMTSALKKQTELNNLKSSFVSMTSHELRTPLTTISTDVELLNYFLDNGDQINIDRFKKIISRMDLNLDRLNHLINNILLIGQLDSQKVPFSPENTDIMDLVAKQIINNYANRDRELKYEVAGNPYQMQVDRKLFTQILDNLVNNAYKYSETGSPELKLEFQEKQLLIHVTDHGIGIPESEHAKMFGSFFRASNVGSVQGSGLGLSIVNQFVKLHDGNITFKSIVNQGTTFTMSFPKN
ncbi:MAG: PAS domain S-box protein [Bacteroidota bacterium]